MSSYPLKKKKSVINLIEMDNVNTLLSKIVLPFNEVIQKKEINDIYQGYEKIPFKVRDPSYKNILLQEFNKAIRDYERLIIMNSFLNHKELIKR